MREWEMETEREREGGDGMREWEMETERERGGDERVGDGD